MKCGTVPRGFSFPSCNVFDMWNAWWEGNAAQGICPFKKIASWDLERSSDLSRLSKARKVMTRIINISNCTEIEIAGLDTLGRRQLFEKSYLILCDSITRQLGDAATKCRRINEINYMTLYDLMKKEEKKRSI